VALRSTVFVIGFSLCSLPWAAAQVSVLDPSGGLASSAILIGDDHLALIAYRAFGALKVAHCDQVACTTATLATLDSTHVGNAVSMARGSDGAGLIAYDDNATHGIRVTRCANPACSSAESFPIATGFLDGIAVGGDGLGLISFRDPVLKLAHCVDAACSSADIVTLPDCSPVQFSAVVSGGDGLGLVICGGNGMPGHGVSIHCNDAACSAPSFSELFTSGKVFLSELRLMTGADGLGLFAMNSIEPPPVHIALEGVSHCEDSFCTSLSPGGVAILAATLGVPLLGAEGLPLVIARIGSEPGTIVAVQCLDPVCAAQARQTTEVPPTVLDAKGGTDGKPLITLNLTGSLAVAHCLSPICDPLKADLSITLSDGVATGVPGQEVAYAIEVSNSGPSAVSGAHVTDLLPAALVDATWSCVASPGSSCPASGSGSIDQEVNIAASGTLTYTLLATVDGAAQGTLVNAASVSVPAPYTDPIGGNNSAVDQDALAAPILLSLADASAVEGTGSESFTLSLSHSSVQTVTVDWQTVPGSATAGADYTPVSAISSFAPGITSQELNVPIVNDHLLELTEQFGLQLSSPAHAVLGVAEATGTILDDDSPHDELVSGSERIGELAAWPGPEERRDYYVLGTPLRTSWEIVVDSASGSVVPLVVERLDADTLQVLQTAVPQTGGSSLSLRWQDNRVGRLADSRANTDRYVVSVLGACGHSCGPEAQYRLQARETTCAIARFNDTGGQVTLVALQNVSDATVSVTTWFWNSTGSLLASIPLTLAPKASTILDTTQLGLGGEQGSITVTHDGSYGALMGKSVALEVATGFTFDTPMTVRAH
jgi:uncharacterized repeat protein (TIGR01451 family)